MYSSANPVLYKKGIYYVKEHTAPKGYGLDSTVYTVEIAVKETAVLHVKDVPKADKGGLQPHNLLYIFLLRS